MKINIFSPLPPAKTEIANNTMQLLPALSRLAQLTLWTDQDVIIPETSAYGEVCHYSPDNVDYVALNDCDITLYHLGNNPSFHYAIWQVSQRHPGVVILHDLVLQGIFLNHHFWNGAAPVYYRNKMHEYYGQESEPDVQCISQGQMDVDAYLSRYPLFELGLENAVAAVVHNRFAFNAVASRNRWPVCHIPLSYLPQVNHWPEKSKHSPYRLIVFGHIGGNRRLDVLLHALAKLPEREKFHLDVFGQLYIDHIPKLVSTLGLKEMVTLHGFVSDEDLCRGLSRAHLAINLRYPTMGETSASQLRIWENKLPSLVTRIGWYGELPESAVAFVRHDNENADLHQHLTAFLANPQHFAEMGKRGYEYLLANHSPENYAQQLMDFFCNLPALRTQFMANKLADRVGELAGQWLSRETGEMAIRSVADKIVGFTYAASDAAGM